MSAQPEEPSGIAARGRALNRDPKLVAGIRKLRSLLPGDDRFGDPLSASNNVVSQRLGELAAERPSVLGEAGLGGLQVWQSLSENVGRGRGERDVAILFTDLVDFSDWAMTAGDDATLALLRDVAEAIEPPVRDQKGEVVKRLGDGMMAVFSSPLDALEAVRAANERLQPIEHGGYRPSMRAGIHLGRPRRIGGDYLGVDVNIAARVADRASPGEILVSGATVEALESADVETKRKRLFRAKGVPDEVTVYSVKA